MRLKEQYEVLWACHKSSEFESTQLIDLEDYKIILEPVVQSERLENFPSWQKSSRIL